MTPLDDIFAFQTRARRRQRGRFIKVAIGFMLPGILLALRGYLKGYATPTQALYAGLLGAAALSFPFWIIVVVVHFRRDPKKETAYQWLQHSPHEIAWAYPQSTTTTMSGATIGQATAMVLVTKARARTLVYVDVQDLERIANLVYQATPQALHGYSAEHETRIRNAPL